MAQLIAALSPPPQDKSLDLQDKLQPMGDKLEGDLQKTASVKTFESQADSDAIRSLAMAQFIKATRRYRQALRAIGSYIWHPQQFLFLIGAIVGLGALAMTGGYHTGKEILYLLVIGLLAVRAIHDHWRHDQRKEITAIIVCLSLLVFSGLLSWTEWQRHAERQAIKAEQDKLTEQTSIPATTTPQAVVSASEQPKRIRYSVNGKDDIDLKGGKVIAFNERSAWTYEGLVQDWHIIEINMPPGSYIITVFHEKHGEFQGKALLSMTGKRLEGWDVDEMMELKPQNK